MSTPLDQHRRAHRVARIGTVVIGAGQAGLTIGYYLRRAGEPFIIVDGDARVGDSWRQRYDSLRLFSRPRYSSLPGWAMPVRTIPTRDEMADYLEQYAARFDLPVDLGRQVTRVSRSAGAFRIETTGGSYLADRVVVATGAHRRPITPGFAADLPPHIRQIHSLDYRRPDQLAPGAVLVVGAGNSGTDIALEAAAHGHPTTLAGRHPGQVPVDIDSTVGRLINPIPMFLFKHVLTRRFRFGREFLAKTEGHGVNLVRNKLADLDAAGISRVGRITGVRDGRPVTADGAALDVTTVVWATGSAPDHDWLDLPVFHADGHLQHRRGIVDAEPGLYFLGLHGQFALASATIQGLDRDARYLARDLRRHRATVAVDSPAVARAA